MMAGENVKAFAPPFNLPQPRGSASSPIFHQPVPKLFGRACAGDRKALTNLSDIRSRPFSYAILLLFSSAGMLSLRSSLFLFYQEKRKSPSGG